MATYPKQGTPMDAKSHPADNIVHPEPGPSNDRPGKYAITSDPMGDTGGYGVKNDYNREMGSPLTKSNARDLSNENQGFSKDPND